MVAKEVKVYSRSLKEDEPGHVWTSSKCKYQIEEVEGQRRGTKIVVFLKDEDKQFASDSNIKEIVKVLEFRPVPDQERRRRQHNRCPLVAEQIRDQG